MAGNWRDKTCEKCEFGVNNRCHRFPPTTIDDKTFYPRISNNRGLGIIDFMKSCAEYKES